MKRDIKPIAIAGHDFQVEDLATSDLRRIVEGELNADHYQLKRTALPNGARIVDIGANIGMTSMVLSRQFPSAKVEAYEPHPENYKSLVANLCRNDCANVRTLQAAVAQKAGKFQMTMGEDNTGGATGWIRNVTNPVTVDAVTLQSIIAGRPIDLLKVDIEGAEHALFADFKGWSLVLHLIVELHQNDFLAEQGYTIKKTEALIRKMMGPKPLVVQHCNPMAQ